MADCSKIIGLEVENVKRIKAVEIHPDPEEPLVVVGGENANGKTSLLDAIMFGLGGKGSIPPEVVRKGEEQAKIEIDLGDITVTRIIGKGAKLIVKSKEGAMYPSPQSVLDELTGKLTFDPLAFARMGETPAGRREQAALLRDMVGLDFEEIDEKRREAFDKRTDVNRDLKRVSSQLESAPRHESAPTVEVSVSVLSGQLNEAIETNADNRREREKLERLIDTKQEIKARLAKLRKELESATTEAVAQVALVDKLTDEPEESIKEAIANAEVVNRQVRENAGREELVTERKLLSKQSETLTKRLTKIDAEKKKLLKDAEMPIEGLGFGADGVAFGGVPFENCSSAEQLKISVAIGIAMNPQLRVMLIRDGSLLDNNSLAVLRDMAKQADTQVWLERVGAGAEVSVVIEDGMVAESL